jgi:hypothetical protein
MARLVLMAAALVLLSGCFFIRVREDGDDRRPDEQRPAAGRVE